MFELRNVTAGYGETMVLRNVSLSVPPQSVVALLGPNGAGKTTLLRVASGLLRPRTGRLRMDGADVTGRRTHQLAAAGICHVPEGRGIFPSLTVRENLIMQARPGGEEAAIERAGRAFPILTDRLAQVAGTMSGGEQQMLALARTYLTGPKVVLLDEVSMGLAPRVVDAIFEFLDRLRSEGASLLLVEQYITRALAMADYVYLLQRGRVAFAGEPAEVDGERVFAQYLGAGLPAASSGAGR
jgi:branched-chain amino acid transport system ATP-binding protein